MAEYLAPGVYVEETSFRAKSIEGVGTSTTGFAGPTRKGPTAGTPELLTSFGDFERIYGGLDNLDYGTNYLAHAVLAFFNEGGARLYVARAINGDATVASILAKADEADATKQVAFKARFPGSAGNGSVVLADVSTPASPKTLATAPLGSTVYATTTITKTSDGSTVSTTTLKFLKQGADSWNDGTATAKNSAALSAPATAPQAGETANVALALMTLSVTTVDADGAALGFDGLGYDKAHPRYVGTVLAALPSRHADQLQNPIAVGIGSAVTGFSLHDVLFPSGASRTITLAGGGDGSAPPAVTPQPANGVNGYDAALTRLGALEDISIIAAPGSSAYAGAQAVNNALIAHAEARRAYRIAVLDTPAAQLVSDVRAYRGQFDSTHAAMYYPWVVVPNPLAKPGRGDIPGELALPPSGFVSGVYARTDVNRGVWKAPANEVVFSALRFELDVNFGQQEVLNPLGVNCLRALPGRGYRIWGARTVSSDPEWKYVNVRRYFTYLEASIDHGTQWAVFEPNGERLWRNVTQTVSDFLYNEWKSGALLGSTPEQAYFVRCDRSTMTQNDLDNGRLVCLVGVAALKPAEFVIFRIGQKTADDRS
ncbi:MAG: hypothetical protein NVS9B10_30940 [Nevskia sp.]